MRAGAVPLLWGNLRVWEGSNHWALGHPDVPGGERHLGPKGPSAVGRALSAGGGSSQRLGPPSRCGASLRTRRGVVTGMWCMPTMRGVCRHSVVRHGVSCRDMSSYPMHAICSWSVAATVLSGLGTVMCLRTTLLLHQTPDMYNTHVPYAPRARRATATPPAMWHRTAQRWGADAWGW